jgi:hypothetical protein
MRPKNDASTVTLHHVRREGPDGIRRPGQVDIDGDVPVRIFHLQQRMELLDPGIGQQDVDAAEFLFGSHSSRPQSSQGLIPTQRRPVSQISRPVASKSSGVDGLTPERRSTGAQISSPKMSEPTRAKAMAVARPIPRGAPVTTATFPCRLSLSFEVAAGLVVMLSPFNMGQAGPDCPDGKYRPRGESPA